MKKFVQWMLLFVMLAIPFGCDKKTNEHAGRTELSISAAASLTDALTEMKKVYETKNDHVSVTLNFGSSRKLATQIDQGAPADIFLSASEEDMDKMNEKGLVVKSSIVDFTGNSIVLIANKAVNDPVDSFEQLYSLPFDHITIGEPDAVPAGRYAKEVLEHLDLWMPLKDKLVMGSDVRQVLTHVEMGNAEYGIVYSTDAFISDKVVVVAEASPSWHTPIVYPGAVVKNSNHHDEAQKFLEFLASEEGKAILQKYGFK
ncbi:molybdate ABC transporter substrate-binding protein [Sporosarcina koreensis]|uniref:Molybdate ABC transporter substrate-binding protein n=1 Tax=Sporosarcina koreensis TaxID=334735 RepID=A0ABW0TWH9_9BACL